MKYHSNPAKGVLPRAVHKGTDEDTFANFVTSAITLNIRQIDLGDEI